jgi:hypothetical protein
MHHKCPYLWTRVAGFTSDGRKHVWSKGLKTTSIFYALEIKEHLLCFEVKCLNFFEGKKIPNSQPSVQ